MEELKARGADDLAINSENLSVWRLHPPHCERRRAGTWGRVRCELCTLGELASSLQFQGKQHFLVTEWMLSSETQGKHILKLGGVYFYWQRLVFICPCKVVRLRGVRNRTTKPERSITYIGFHCWLVGQPLGQGISACRNLFSPYPCHGQLG